MRGVSAHYYVKAVELKGSLLTPPHYCFRASCHLDIEACATLMHQMREAQIKASKAILSYVVPSASDLIKQVREQVTARGLASANMNIYEDEIEIIEVLGEGSFGKVRRTCQVMFQIDRWYLIFLLCPPN